MQASPLLLGLFLSPVTLVMTPSSTVMLRPQPTPQKPQIVLACLVSTAVVANSLTPLPHYRRGSHSKTVSLYDTRFFCCYTPHYTATCDLRPWWARYCCTS